MLTKFPGGLSVGSLASSDSHPAEKYLASLRSPQSQRTMRTALNNIAVLHGVKPTIRYGRDEIGRERKQDVTYLNSDWTALTPQQVTAIRSRLIRLYPPSSI